jgi:hypothetical protein
MLTGLSGWEIVAFAGLCALAYMAVAGTIGFTLAWLIYGERAPRAVAAPAPKPAVAPVPAPVPQPAPAPGFAPAATA